MKPKLWQGRLEMQLVKNSNRTLEVMTLANKGQSTSTSNIQKRRFATPLFAFMLASILSSQLEAEVNSPQYQVQYPHTKGILDDKNRSVKAQESNMLAVIEGLSGLSGKQKTSLLDLYTSSQNKLKQLRGSMVNLNTKQQTLSPGNHKYQSQMENIVELKSALGKEHSQLKSQFKRQLIQLLTPKQRQQLQLAIQQKNAVAKGIDRSWM